MLLLFFSCSVLSNFLWSHGLQQARLPCPSPFLELAQAHVHWVGDVIQPSHPLSSPHLILCHPLLLLPSIFHRIRVFFNELVLPISWPKYWSFSFSINPSNEYSGLNSFRIDWFDLIVHGTLKSLQHHSSKASILWHSAFFIVPLSHTYMTIGKTIVSTRWNLIGKVMSLLFNSLSRFLIAFLPKRVFNFMAAVTVHSDFGTQENKVCLCFHFFPIYLPWSDGTGCHDLSFLNVEL